MHDLQVTHEALDSLTLYHHNPRRGATPVIRESLEVNGQYRPLVVNTGGKTGRTREVLAGNHTLLAAREAGWDDIQVCWVDVDDQAAARIVAADNRTTDLATYDDRELLDLLNELTEVTGTGYTPGDMDDLAAALEEQSAALPGTTGPALDGSTAAPGEDGLLNAAEDHVLERRAAQYHQRDTRSMYLTFLLPEFEWVVPRLAALAERYDVETHTEAVLRLVAEATGDEPPQAEGERNRLALTQ